LGLGNQQYSSEPIEISSLSKIEVLPFETKCHFIGEWNSSNHKLFPQETKEEIFTILLLSLFHPTTSHARHPTTIFYKLPRDMRFELFKFIATPHSTTLKTPSTIQKPAKKPSMIPSTSNVDTNKLNYSMMDSSDKRNEKYNFSGRASFVDAPLKKPNVIRTGINTSRKNEKYNIEYSELIIQSKVGEGAFGIVFKAKWRGAPVAVKQIKSSSLQPGKREKFLEECQFMKNLQPHYNVVNFLGTCEEPLCMITEYCQNGSVKSLLESERPMNMQLRRKILTDVAAGMYHLQNEKVVHRDLAARNCLLTESNVTKVGDFGLSRLAGEDLGITSEYGNWPLKWLSPETLRDKIFNNKTDLWSYGILCIEVLTRHDPYPEFSLDDFARKVMRDNLTSTAMNYVPSDVPEIIREIAIGCLQIDPSKRPGFGHIYQKLESLNEQM